jgi:hypothetical protein
MNEVHPAHAMSASDICDDCGSYPTTADAEKSGTDEEG